MDQDSQRHYENFLPPSSNGYPPEESDPQRHYENFLPPSSDGCPLPNSDPQRQYENFLSRSSNGCPPADSYIPPPYYTPPGGMPSGQQMIMPQPMGYNYDTPPINPSPPQSMANDMADGRRELTMRTRRESRMALQRESRPVFKRTKQEPRLNFNNIQHLAAEFGTAPQSNMTEGEFSICCSSCSEGVPCAKTDCESQREKVVPCPGIACDKPLCTDNCLNTYGERPEYGSDRQSDYSERTPWNNSTYAPQVQHPGATGFPPMPFGNFEQPYYDPAQNSQFASGLPSDHMASPAARNLNSYSELAGTGEMFNGSQHMELPTQCNWTGCGQALQNPAELCQHLHEQHCDPQLRYVCPILSCPKPIESDPLEHLETEHGVSFPNDDSGYSCPAPKCSPEEVFYDPSLLHDHLDKEHSTPATGELHCEWNTCSTVVSDSNELFTHLNEQHQLQVSVSGEEDIDLTPAIPRDQPLPQLYIDHVSGEEAIDLTPAIPRHQPVPHLYNDHLRCKWFIGPGLLCGETAVSEADLQLHIKVRHLNPLDKDIGFVCQWDGCRRGEKLGDRQGFSQRGKLERHMASHTGYKCCKCDFELENGDVCGKVFSAPQALHQHKLLHTGEKPWECQHCHKRFPQQSAKTIHERIHTKEKPLKCEICGRDFSESSNLAKHRKTHGEKGNYSCPVPGCGKSFVRLDQIRNHERTHTPAQYPQISQSHPSSVLSEEPLMTDTGTEDFSSEPGAQYHQ